MLVRGSARRSLSKPSICIHRLLPKALVYYGKEEHRNGVTDRYSTCTSSVDAVHDDNTKSEFLKIYKDSFAKKVPLKSTIHGKSSNEHLIGQTITVQGFIGRRKDLSDNLSFVKLILPEGGDCEDVQVVSRAAERQKEKTTYGQNMHQKLKSIKPHSAVSVTGVLGIKRQPKGKEIPQVSPDAYLPHNLEIDLRDVTCLAAFPEDIIVSDEVQFPPESRHLQIRFDHKLRERLHFRSALLRLCRQELADFDEIETPVLFKSTPEGAREFLVPTRRSGYAYALPQSPQQYKQILMASGIHRYFQIAKCFRDEDLRADRQPEFTQIDMEMAFSDGNDVMNRIEVFIYDLFKGLQNYGSIILPPDAPFLRITYDDAMRLYGSDKPDLRIPDQIHPVDSLLSTQLISMLTSLSNPIVESWKIRLDGDPSMVRSFVQEFMDSSEATPFQQNPDGPPGIFIYDPRKPLEGLQAFGFEGAEALKTFYADASPDKHGHKSVSSHSISDDKANEPFTEGDLIILQSRPRLRFSGGSTALGRLRTAIYKAALSKGLITQDPKDYFLWVVDFPLFTLNNGIDPGQGGNAGFSATHHPFTAPKTAADVDLLFSNPLEAVADHYDLVLNGVELGGGSRRIHNSEMQQFVMRDILEMSEERLTDFSHLFEALRAGCPPHAGIALGLDRLVALMVGVESVRDVIAFPKSGKGEDLMVKSPTLMTKEQQKTYHLSIVE